MADEMVEIVARAIWEQRRKFAGAAGIGLEEWGDGAVPLANGILAEAAAAIIACIEVREACGVCGQAVHPKLDRLRNMPIEALGSR